MQAFLSGLKRNPLITLLLLATSACAHLPFGSRTADYSNWAVYYGTDATAEQLDMYDMLVLDSTAHLPLEELDQPRQRILGYASLGEATQEEMQRLPQLSSAVLAENTTWHTYVMDLTSPAWQHYLLEERLPAIMDKGFDGFMLDTLDSPLHHGAQQNNAAAQNMAALYLLETIRARFPDAYIMLNRGFGVYPYAASYINAALAESILSHYNLRTGEASYFEDRIYGEYVGKLRAARVQNPQLAIYTLDYWSPGDAYGIQSIYNIQRRHGFMPYVSTPDLKHLYPQVRPVESPNFNFVSR